jgi:hypothetical protein
MGHNIEQEAGGGGGGGGGLTFVEIQRFCGICPKTFETDCKSNYLVKTWPNKETRPSIQA